MLQRRILLIGLVGLSVPFCIVKCLAHECIYTESRGRVGKAQPWRPAEGGGLDDILFNNLTSNLSVFQTDKCSRAPEYPRSEEHTSELQSRRHLVCRLLLE